MGVNWFGPAGTDNKRTHFRTRLLSAVLVTVTLVPSLARAQNGSNPFANAKLYVDPNSKAARTADDWKRARPADAAALQKIAQQPTAKWMGSWSTDIRRDVSDAVSRMTRAGALPVLVAYNIPHRDCGLYSRGGEATGAKYRQWIRNFAAGLSGRKSVVILEPDAIAGADCLQGAAKEERFALIRDAVNVLKGANASVYIDAGNAKWLRPEEVAARLLKAAVDKADGFSLNVSNYIASAPSIEYGEQISRRVGGKHFVIDTSRNGAGNASHWCNAQGQAIGPTPTTRTNNALVDAFLWVKLPGESDGECERGEPRAGQWWPEYAVRLAQRAPGSVSTGGR